MSKMGANPPIRRANAAKGVSSILEKYTFLDPGLYPGENGGAYRDRTDDLMLAKQPLSQLS